jgi:hypothetical protein
LELKIWVYFKAILVLLKPFGVFYLHLPHFVAIWSIFYHFGKLQQEKSGNPGRPAARKVITQDSNFRTIFKHFRRKKFEKTKEKMEKPIFFVFRSHSWMYVCQSQKSSFHSRPG